MDNVVISENIKYEKIVDSFKKGGKNKIHFLVDFDRTLTKNFVKGEERTSLISILRTEGYLGDTYSKHASQLFNYYHPIEIDTNIGLNEKKEKMKEWWGKHLDLLIRSQLQKKHIRQIIQSGIIELREGYKAFFHTLEVANIPLVIISANGLGTESISLYLKNKGLLTKNVHIISNTLIWDDNGHAIGKIEPLIHTFNKDEAVLKEFPDIYKSVQNRKNVVLMGDSLGDTQMADGFQSENLLKIGFLNKNISENIKEYSKNYDVVIPGDGDLSFINKLLNKIIK